MDINIKLNKMEPVSIVTIKEILPLYKSEEKANNVELIHLEEAGFDIVSQKGLYKVGDKAIYILPDYCVSDNDLFQEFIAPKGDESKSYLGKIDGKPRRIRAKKFSLHKGDNLPLYSNGILLSYYEVGEYLQDMNLHDLNLTSELGITKYELPEEVSVNTNSKGYTKSNMIFPTGLYKTDETNINLLWDHIENVLTYPVRLIGTEKIDGSSISIGVNSQYPNGFITSRNVNKQIFVNKVIGRRNKKFFEKLLFWKQVDLNLYETQLNNDSFVINGYPHLQLLLLVSLKDVVLRGELNGKGNKGSGNINNPSLKYPSNIKFFGADKYIDGIATKMNHKDFMELCRMWDFPTVPILFNKVFNSRKEIETFCENYFIERKKNTKEIIEGIVLKTEDCMFSAKYMNNEYDSKK